jgi:hypothetical protein
MNGVFRRPPAMAVATPVVVVVVLVERILW